MGKSEWLSSAILSLIFSCFWLGGPCICSGRRDIIKAGEGLLFAEKLLVSARGTFTLGFFTLGLGGTRTYLGVWYTNDVNKKKVWVANRDKPTSGTNASLTLDGHGKLMITHSEGDPVVLNSNQASGISVATLLDSGNFVVSELNSDGSMRRTLWESFEDPTDTLLPGMKLGMNLKTRKKWSLSSWMNEQLPAPGTFTLEWNGTQLIMKRRGEIYWRSGILKDESFEFISSLRSETDHHNVYYFITVSNENEMYFSYSAQDYGAASTWVLNWRGGFYESLGSSLFVKEDACDHYYDSHPGCIAQQPPSCSTRDYRFMKQAVLDSGYPSLMNLDTSLGLSDCQAICWNNCSCTACNTVFTNGTGCQFWRDKLPRAQEGDANQEQLYVLSPSKHSTGNYLRKWIIIGGIAMVIMLFFCCIWIKRKGDRDATTGDREGRKVKLPPDGGPSGTRRNGKGKKLELLPIIGPSATKGDKLLPEVKASDTTEDKPLEVGPSETTVDRKGKKIEAGPSDITGDKPLEVVPSRTTRDRKGEKMKPLPEVRPSNITGDEPREVVPSRTTRDRKGEKIKPLPEVRPSNITGDEPPEVVPCRTTRDRKGHKIKPLPEVRPSNITGDEPPEVVPSRTTRDRKGHKIKPLPAVRPSNITGDEPPEVVPCRTTGDRKGEKIKPLPEVRPSNITGDEPPEVVPSRTTRDRKGDKIKGGEASGTKRNGELLLLDSGTAEEVKRGESTSRERCESSTANKLRDSKDIDNVERFSFDDVVAATNKFSDQNKIGEGGFGPVFKGKLSGGQEIAVKKLSSRCGQGGLEFDNEIRSIAKLQHINFVRLLGFCIEGEEKILIYELMPNKSLDVFLFDPDKRKILDWKKRYNIIKGIAQGLVYLHEHSRVKIIHRDIKASNILLDKDMNPKISDFGLARIVEGNASDAIMTSKIKGTFGYMAPEILSGTLSDKTDVYSFGILLLEIVSGRKNNQIDSLSNDGATNIGIGGCAWRLWGESKTSELVDQILVKNRDSNATDLMLRCIHVALLCIQNQAEDRPKMSDVIHMLRDKTNSLPKPKAPAFCNQQDDTGKPKRSCSSYYKRSIRKAWTRIRYNLILSMVIGFITYGFYYSSV